MVIQNVNVMRLNSDEKYRYKVIIHNKRVPCQLYQSKKIWDKFKSWVEQTQLFNALLKYSGNPNCRIEAFTDKEYLEFQLNGNKVEKFEDLPKELLLKFYLNSPWHNAKLKSKQRVIQNFLLNED